MNNSFTRAPSLFSALTLPSLRLAIYRGLMEDFKVFLARSNHPLERLIFGATTTVTEQRAEYIALIPSLEVQWRG